MSKRITEFECWVLLSLVKSGGMHATALCQDLRTVAEREIPLRRVQESVTKLLEKGLLESAKASYLPPREEGKTIMAYTVTRDGRDALVDHLRILDRFRHGTSLNSCKL